MSPSTNESSSGVRRRFHLKEKIGEGAFGEVYLAEQDSGAGFLRPVALKVLNAHVSGSKEAARRMRDEARILGRLSHRNIVSVLDLVRLGDRWAVVMDFVPGADLEQVLLALWETKDPFPPLAAIEIGAAIFRALDVAYHADDGKGGRLGVVHRDIKPSNVRVTVDGEVKVLDFGVARVDMDTREAQTRAQGWIGTERYMAPERILNEGDEPWGDVYAAGATVIELILGRPLGRTPVLRDRHQPVVEAAMDEVRNRLEGEPEAVDELVELLGLSVDSEPTNRPTAKHLCDRLTDLSRTITGETLSQFGRRFLPSVPEILGNTSEPASGILSEGTSAAAPTLTGAATSSAPSQATYLPSETTSSAGSARRPLFFGLLGLAVVVALGVAAIGVVSLILVAGYNFGVGQDVPVEVTPPVTDVVPPTDPVLMPPEVEGTQLELPDVPELVVPVVPVVQPTPVIERAPDPITRPDPTPTPVVVPEPAAPVAAGPLVDAATFAVQDAGSLTVNCNGVKRSGTSSVRLRNFPGGTCTIEAVYGGKRVTGTVEVNRRREVRCSVTGGALSCGG